MKIRSVYCFCVILTGVLFSMSSEARDRKFGAGIIVGEPTGITAKYYFSEKVAVDAIASWSFLDDAFMLISDVEADIFKIKTTARDFELPIYLGAGAILGFDRGGNDNGRTMFGVRVPVGISANWTKHHVEVYLEVAPGIKLVPETEFDITGGVGVRYWF